MCGGCRVLGTAQKPGAAKNAAPQACRARWPGTNHLFSRRRIFFAAKNVASKKTARRLVFLLAPRPGQTAPRRCAPHGQAGPQPVRLVNRRLPCRGQCPAFQIRLVGGDRKEIGRCVLSHRTRRSTVRPWTAACTSTNTNPDAANANSRHGMSHVQNLFRVGVSHVGHQTKNKIGASGCAIRRAVAGTAVPRGRARCPQAHGLRPAAQKKSLRGSLCPRRAPAAARLRPHLPRRTQNPNPKPQTRAPRPAAAPAIRQLEPQHPPPRRRPAPGKVPSIVGVRATCPSRQRFPQATWCPKSVDTTRIVRYNHH